MKICNGKFLFIAILVSQSASAKCGLENDVFTTAKGNKIYLNFEQHIDQNTYNVIGDIQSKKEDIMEAVSSMNEEAAKTMKNNAQRIANEIKAKDIKWIGGEISNDDQYARNRLEALSMISSTNGQLIRAGVERNKANLASAWFWRSHNIILSLAPKDRPVTIVPLEKRDSQRAGLKADEAFFSFIDETPPKEDDSPKFRVLYQAILKAVGDNDPKTMRDNFNNMQTWARDLAQTKDVASPDSGKSRSEIDRLKVMHEMARQVLQAFSDRNLDMAASVLAQEGNGVICSGSAHRVGIIAALQKSCLNTGPPGYRPGKEKTDP